MKPRFDYLQIIFINTIFSVGFILKYFFESVLCFKNVSVATKTIFSEKTGKNRILLQKIKSAVNSNIVSQGRVYKRDAVLDNNPHHCYAFLVNKILLHESLLSSVHFTFARSSGPGGQNVNKVNTKVYAYVAITSLEGLFPVERVQIRKKLENTINQQDELYISVQEERSQERNRERALFLLEQKIINAAYIQAKRIKSKPSRAAKEKRLKNKRLKSTTKQLRSSIHQ